MHLRCALCCTCVWSIALLPGVALGQSATYHLHKEASKTAGLFQLKTIAPDSGAATLATDLKNQPANEYLVKAFDTAAGTPNAIGIIPVGSVVTFTVWMRKTASAGVMYPRAKLKLNSGTGTMLCLGTGSTPLTTTVASYTLSCTTAVNVAMSASDRLYLWVGVNVTTAAGNNAVRTELRIEGTLNGKYDSQVVAPLPIPPPSISSVSPASAPPGSAVSIAGSNFGASQGGSAATFNGVLATATAWSAESITALVPGAASTGPVVVTVRGVASNTVPFTVTSPPSIAGVVVRATGGGPIAGATVSALSMGFVVGVATTAGDGSYALSGLNPGSYDLRVVASGYADETRQGVAVAPAATTTVNVGMLKPGNIAGRVTESDGTTPIVAAAISVFAASSRIAGASTDDSGYYSVEGLHPGTYIVQAAADGRRTAEQTASVAENTTATATFSLEGEHAGPVAYAYDAMGRLIQVSVPSGEFAVYHYDPVGNLLAVDRPSAGVSIGGFTPGAAPIGASVTIIGGGFGATAAENIVTFNGAAATVESASSTRLVATVPSGASTGPIGVSSASGSATSAAPFVVSASSGAPTITGFTPTIGVPGTPVAVTGTNFDPAIANDRVDVNGRAATVAGAAETTLTTSVPIFTMGGRLSVTTPLGRAVSGADFIVPPSPYGPPDVEAAERLILGVDKTITIGAIGKIGLLLFDGVSGQRVSFIVASSTIGSGTIVVYRPDSVALTSTSYTTAYTFIDTQSLPLTGTYTIMIDPAGSNTGELTLSSFFVSDTVNSTAADGSPVPVTISTPGQNAYLTFDGIAGQMLSVTATSNTWTSCQFGGQYSLAILNPDTSLLASVGNACGATTTLERVVLPVSGAFTIRLDAYGARTGSADIALWAFTDVTGPIPTDGTEVPVSISAPSQLAVLTFAGVAGQLVTATALSYVWTSCQFGGQYALSILKPDGSVLASVGNACGALTVADHYVLPVSGAYTLKFDPYGAAVGTATLRVWTFADVTGSIVADGTSVPVSLTVPGQNARLTFDGTAGQVISVLVPAGTIPGTCYNYAYWLWILKPDGSTLATTPSCFGTAFLDQRALPVSGTYTLVVDPLSANTGDATLRLFTVVDVTGAIATDGTAVPVSITIPGQNARLTFTGTAGQVVTASATNPTFPGTCFNYAFYFTILKRDGSTLASTPSCGGNVALSQKTLPTDGTYTLVLDPTSTNAGSATLKVTSP